MTTLDRLIPRVLESPKETWSTMFPLVITALLSDWFAKIPVTAQEDIYALTDIIMLLVAQSAVHSIELLRIVTTEVVAFAVSTNHRTLARTLLREAAYVYGQIDFQYLSSVMIPLAFAMSDGGWSALDEPFLAFWTDGMNRFVQLPGTIWMWSQEMQSVDRQPCAKFRSKHWIIVICHSVVV
ncbi:hypothetical protein SISNIDRAFT_461608 [Sistotremastrum niveocremeum HHB9708]|uniref:Uncharacterized protein n=1 Tax=Sistotremastrum niveocremeum HHB9708 TaxID=1314777 RepID=A0A164MET3_9AGAM|nr:hypothetical protein SISNIDRAFT_461608 [Sistotremastrum niveocremeum HHB9708]